MKEYASNCIKVLVPEVDVVQNLINKKVKGKKKHSCYFCKINQDLNYLYSVILLNFLLKNTELGIKIDADKLYFISMDADGESEPLFSIPSSQVHITRSSDVEQTTICINLNNEIDILEPV